MKVFIHVHFEGTVTEYEELLYAIDNFNATEENEDDGSDEDDGKILIRNQFYSTCSLPDKNLSCPEILGRV